MKKIVSCPTAGHPDKICDQVADAIVDEFLRRDEAAIADIDVIGSHGMMMIGGEVLSKADFDCSALAREVYADIGYEDDIEVFVNLNHIDPSESSVTAQERPVVARGYAVDETRERLPRPVVFARNIARRIDDLRETDPAFSWMLPDGMVQLVLEKDTVQAVTILIAHTEDIAPKDVRTAILDRVITPIVGENGVQIYINPDENMNRAGFQRASGANDRHIAADTYGGLIPNGNGRFAGATPNRIERAAGLLARQSARYLVDQGLVKAAYVTLSYTPGKKDPIVIQARGMGEKSKGSKMDLTNVLKNTFSFDKSDIAEELSLLQPVYRQATTYGYFGRVGFPWEEEMNDSGENNEADDGSDDS
jgi:S-adenosylmethionine synthetase